MKIFLFSFLEGNTNCGSAQEKKTGSVRLAETPGIF